MNNRTATPRRGAFASFVRVIRGFAEASLVVLGFAFAILLIGLPIALIVRALHEGVSWLAEFRGDVSAVVEALVSISTVAGGLILGAVFVRLLVGFFNWRRTARARGFSGVTPDTQMDGQGIARAA
jgi:hypothetical protein